MKVFGVSEAEATQWIQFKQHLFSVKFKHLTWMRKITKHLHSTSQSALTSAPLLILIISKAGGKFNIAYY